MAHLKLWKEKWEKSDEPNFHRLHVFPSLVKFKDRFLPRDERLAVLVPLCGKSLDMKFILDAGYPVIGVESNEKALWLFGKENNIDLEAEEVEDFGIVLRSNNNKVQLYCGDLLTFSPRFLDQGTKIGAVFDKGSLVAIEPEMRDQYFEIIGQFCTNEDCTYLVALYDHDLESFPPHLIPVEYMCGKVAEHNFKMLDVDLGENFGGGLPLKNPARTKASRFIESGYLFSKSKSP